MLKGQGIRLCDIINNTEGTFGGVQQATELFMLLGMHSSAANHDATTDGHW